MQVAPSATAGPGSGGTPAADAAAITAADAAAITAGDRQAIRFFEITKQPPAAAAAVSSETRKTKGSRVKNKIKNKRPRRRTALLLAAAGLVLLAAVAGVVLGVLMGGGGMGGGDAVSGDVASAGTINVVTLKQTLTLNGVEPGDLSSDSARTALRVSIALALEIDFRFVRLVSVTTILNRDRRERRLSATTTTIQFEVIMADSGTQTGRLRASGRADITTMKTKMQTAFRAGAPASLALLHVVAAEAGIPVDNLKFVGASSVTEASRNVNVDEFDAREAPSPAAEPVNINIATPSPAAPLPPFAAPGDRLLAGQSYTVRRSTAVEFLSLAASKNTNTTLVPSRWSTPCAHSYEGSPWEVTQPRAGPDDSLIHIVSCTTSSCVISIPRNGTAARPNKVYLLLAATQLPPSFQSEKYANDRAAAHFLMQASYGGTRSEINALSAQISTESTPGDAARAWVFEQIDDAPPTLHREFYRSRANPRLDAPTEVGRPRGACEPNSRWNRIAIRGDDAAQNISFSNASGIVLITIGGVLRSEVNMFDLRPFGLGAPVKSNPAANENCNWCQSGGIALDTPYQICRVQEWPGGTVVVGSRCDGQLYPGADDRTVLYNVLMRFDQTAYPATDRFGETVELVELGANDATVFELEPSIYNTGVLMISALHIACPFSYGGMLRISTTVKYEGAFYRYDPRLVLESNTLKNPLNISSTKQNYSRNTRSCALLKTTNVPKTSVNEHTCVMTHGCSPDRYDASTTFELNASTLRQFWAEGNNFVYAIDDLPLDSNHDPCSKRARWRSLGACNGRETTSISVDTKRVLASAINSSTDAPNAVVRDAEIPNNERSLCSGVQGIGAIVDVDGICWEHVHNDLLNVYDFTLWTMDHGGNIPAAGFYPIKNVAYDGDSVLKFPSWHAINRWTKNSGGSWTSVGEPLGKMGQILTFNDLPFRVQSAGFAQAVNVDAVPAQGVPDVESCGSPGEVANNPLHGQIFYFGKERYKNVAAFSQQEVLHPFRQQQGGNQKQTVWSTIALTAPDQLRQRVAWALAQTCVVGEFSSEVLNDHVEVWASYYDIFVRHAFGNYKNVLHEVSFNPIMAKFLTFYRSESFAFSGSSPDENYAREIMQLFSLGLWQLNMDGTRKLNEVGEPIPVYANNNIAEFARVWTGFVSRDLRGNLENKRISYSNQVDPLLIVPERRDAFPKMNLYGGFLGDTYPLCNDLEPQAYLRAGAKFRYLGRSGVPDLLNGDTNWAFGDAESSPHKQLFTPWSNSSLYARLCNARNKGDPCRFQSSVLLSENIACFGPECAVDTLRIIRVVHGSGPPVYFEYVQQACVSLAFFAGAKGGRYIENVNWIPSHDSQDELIERICADPNDPVAAPGCCSEEFDSCFEYTCKYVEERTAFRKALDRCDASVSAWSSPLSSSSAKDNSNSSQWWLWPHEYRTKPTACPSGSRSPSQEECEEAAEEALRNSAEPHFNAPGRFETGSKSNRPPGCLVSTTRGDVYFNTASSGSGHGDYKLVCNTSIGAAHYNGTSPFLCSRKRRSCWWDNSATNCDTAYDYGDHLTTNLYWWTEERCTLQAQVNIDGVIAVVHPGSESVRRVGINSGNWFHVQWARGRFPTAPSCATNGNGCAVIAGEAGPTCLCDVDMTMRAVFTNAEALPKMAEALSELHIGAPEPGHFAAGTYTVCTTVGCAAAQTSDGLRVFTRGSAFEPLMDDSAIFAVISNQSTLYLANKRSVVTIANASEASAFKFRNPPQFMSLVDPKQRDALYETDALLDHLFWHENLAPFIAKTLIQKLVTSNPSPAYVKRVATAFKTGEISQGRVFSGKYGDMGAAAAATILDREARSSALSRLSPFSGAMREPLLKTMHFIRAMELTPHNHRAFELSDALDIQIGQAVYKFPTVFSFTRPDYSPEGPVQAVGLVSPEAQLGILPHIIGYADGISSLVFDGLTSCKGGLGSYCNRNAAMPPSMTLNATPAAALSNNAYLAFEPTDASSVEAVMDELSLVLTAGRLDEDEYTRGVISEAYLHALNESSCPVDRSAEMCGRMVPGDALKPGERLMNAAGEVLCVTYQGVARHIGVDGHEVFSTAYLTREKRTSLIYESSGRLKMAGSTWWGTTLGYSNTKWNTEDYAAGSTRDAFHRFLAGPCKRLEARAFDRVSKFGYTDFGAVTETITCNAPQAWCDGNAKAMDVVRPEGYAEARQKTDAVYAFRVAQQLVAMSAAFATTNYPATNSNATAPLPPPRLRKNPGSYKALVVLFMAGGADTFNMLVPHSGCDNRNSSAWYTRTRGAAALDLSSLRTISVDAGTQPCDTMGIHPELSVLKQLYDDGDASFEANIGSLVEPVSRKQVIDREGRLPAGLFAHNLQTQGAKTLFPQETTGGTGILGRILRALEDQAAETPVKATAYSITRDKTIFRGSPIEPVLLSSYQGMLTYEGSETAARAINFEERKASKRSFARLASNKAGSVFAETYNDALRRSLADSESISKLLENATLTQNWGSAIKRASVGHGQSFVAQLEQVASVIAARHAFEAEVDVFYIELGGFDTHADVLAAVNEKFKDIDVALTAFVAEMKALGVWNNVALQSLSEFGRTMTSNGRGTDHAWGGNHFLIGGDVSGGKIHGQYPELRIDGPQSVNRLGAMLPGSPWEAIWKPLAQWLGVEDGQLGGVMPNLKEFFASELYAREDMFDSLR